MRRTQRFLRIAAVCSSFLLVAAYVMYRSNAGVKAMPGSKSDRVTATEPATQAAGDRAVFYSSKSGPVALPPARASTQPFDLGAGPSSALPNAPAAPASITINGTGQRTPQFLPGSKSAGVISPGDAVSYMKSPATLPATTRPAPPSGVPGGDGSVPPAK